MIRARCLWTVGALCSMTSVLPQLACSSSPPSPATGGADASDDGMAAAAPSDGGVVGLDSASPPSDGSTVPDALPPFVDPYGGASGCDGGYKGGDQCGAEVLLHGGIDALFTGQGCGASTGSPSLSVNGVLDSRSLEFVITFPSGIDPGQVGVQPPATVEIALFGGGTDAGQMLWITPPGACSVTFDSNVCTPSVVPDSYGISGTGSCSQPAAPQPGNSSSPVSISSFSFSTYWVGTAADQ